MTKFSGSKSRPVRASVSGPIKTTDQRVPTFEGGDGWSREPESELFLLAVTNMVGEKTFYESALMRDDRFRRLIHQVTKTNPDFIRGSDPAAGKVGLAQFLRDTMNMRSASVVMVCEYVAAGGPNGRQVVARTLSRADEPAEAVGYWMTQYGKALPKPLKRGIADAAKRLYNERSALRYDGESRGIRMGDVLEITHPGNVGEWQRALWTFLIDTRHNRAKSIEEYGMTRLVTEHVSGTTPLLPVLAQAERLGSVPEKDRRQFLRDNPGILRDAGFSWERLSGWLPGGMDAEAWEFVIGEEAKGMGYMALLRNLRNFDQKGVSDKVKLQIVARLADQDEVAHSRQFPYRFWSAYKAAPSLIWGHALEMALDQSVQNIPVFKGRTLVLIDTSGSMQTPVSDRSEVMRYEVGALFGAALARKQANCDVVLYASDSEKWDVPAGGSVLRYIESVRQRIGRVGHGTAAYAALDRHYNGHDRVVFFTDEQTHDSYSHKAAQVPFIHTFNLAGYRAAMAPNGTKGRYAYGGFSDATFTLMGLLEAGKNADWPF